MRQELVERAELVIHGDAQRLEGALEGLPRLLRTVGGRDRLRQGATHAVGKLDRGIDRLLVEGAGDGVRIGFVGVLDQKIRQVRLGNGAQQGCSGPSLEGIEPEVERAVLLVGEAPCRIIKLHRRDAQVRQHEIQSAAKLGKEPSEAGKVHASDHQDVLGEAQCAQARLGPGQLQGIHVDADETAARSEARQNRLRVSAEAQRGVEAHVSRPGI